MIKIIIAGEEGWLFKQVEESANFFPISPGGASNVTPYDFRGLSF
jgi:hypothetical protein